MAPEDEGKYRKNIRPGIEVDITEKRGRPLTRGIVKEILTRSDEHPYGIMVRLEDDTIGRVKRILTEPPTGHILAEKTIERPSQRNIDSILQTGENAHIEFKSSALWSLDERKRNERKDSPAVKTYNRDASKFIIARALASFLNTSGGDLVIGIREDKQKNQNMIIGIDHELRFLRDATEDGYLRMFVDGVVGRFLPVDVYNHFDNYFTIEFPSINNKILCWIRVKKSPRPVFIKYKNAKEIFFIRVSARTKELQDKELAEYCLRHFN